MSELEKRIKKLIHQQVEYYWSCWTQYGPGELSPEHLDTVAKEFAEEAKKEYPDRCSGWRELNEDLILRPQCRSCMFRLDCSIPKFKKRWFGK